MGDTNHKSARSAATIERPPWLWYLYLTATFFLAQHNLSYAVSGIGNYNFSADDIVGAVAKGSLVHQVVLFSLGLVTLVSLMRNRANRPHLDSPLGWSLLCFVVLAAASPAWADDVRLTVTRTAVFCILCAASVAVARRLSIRELIWWILFSSFLFVIIGIVAEVFFGTFRPFASGYRFAGTLHPNGQGIQCGLLLLSALAAADLTKRWRALFWACALLGLVFLILSGSRMALGATTLSLVGYFGAAFSRTAKVAAVCGLGIFFCSLLLFSGPGSLSGIKNAAMLGRIDDPADDNSLNGRTMIWEEAGSYIRQRPILGYGYGGFWTPAHIEAISDKENWGVAASHSAYLDCVLTLGLVGLFMYVVLLIGGIGRAFRFYRASQDPTFAFCGGLLILFAVDGLLDSVILGVSLLLFVCMVVLARLAFLCRLEQPQGHS